MDVSKQAPIRVIYPKASISKNKRLNVIE